MHVPLAKPACWTDIVPEPRVGWAWDKGRGCGQARDPETWAVNIRHTPGCMGCARARRSFDVRAGIARD